MTASPNRQAKWRGANFERATAKKVGGVRVGRSKAVRVGDRHIDIDPQHPPDVVTTRLSIECKYMKEVPVGILSPMAQACRNAPQGLVPVVFMGDRNMVRLVILREADFLNVNTQPTPANALSAASQGHSRRNQGEGKEG